MLTFSGFTQFRKGLVVGLNKVSAITPFDGFPVFLYADVSHELQKSFSSYGLEIGINLNKNINLMVEVAFMNLSHGISYEGSNSKNMKTIKTGLNLNYRFLKSSVFSPKIGFRIGVMPYSDLIDKKVNYFTLVQNDSGNSNYTFRSWNGYGNLDVLLSIQLENLIIDIGGELNYLGYTIDYFHNSIDGKIRAYGLGYKIGINYILPFKKREASSK